MSKLVPSAITLDKGLDLQTPKPVALPGTVLDSLNYEQVDFQGQKRIDGYTRYDGSPLSALDDVLLVTGTAYGEFGPYTLALNNDKIYGVIITNLEDGRYVVAVIDYTNLPANSQWAVDELEADEHYELVLSANAYLRSLVEGLPGPIVGLHWFRDRLYAVVNIGDYTPADSYIDTFGKASLFESRTIQQVLNEDGDPYDFGWKFVHQGWLVYFMNGKVLFGDLTARNQNREGVGVLGPTSTDGSNGSPLILTQKVSITNGQPQVNGWKSSSTPTSYVLDPSDVVEIDSTYAYADAYISWDGASSVVSAPGSDGVGLIEYPATNSVNVEVP